MTVKATEGMVCSIDHLASQAGLAMLRGGGSAADAAVATSAVLAVTSQHMCGMGGDLLAVVVPPRGSAGDGPLSLNSSGWAGSGADPDRLRAEGYDVMPFRGDIRSVTLPGCVDGWVALHDRFGRLPLATVLEPARLYAENGFPASPTLALAVQEITHLTDASDFARARPLRSGTVVRRRGVARALATIADGGRAGFYEGEFGTQLLRMAEGEFAPEDLTVPLAQWSPALACDAWDETIWTVPPASQGYLTLSSAWIASRLPLPPDPEDPIWAHLLIEAARQAAYDRVEVLHEHATGGEMLRPSRLAPRVSAIETERAAAVGGASRPGGTIALCAVDSERMGVSLLQSNAAGFGALLVVPGAQVFLHNRGIGFSLQEGHPAEYGPRRRPPHTLCPTAVTSRDGVLRGVLGTMGGDSQPQILLQLLARWLHAHQSPGTAVAAGRWVLSGGTTFDTWRVPGQVRVSLEGQCPAAWRDGLESRGHETHTGEAWGHQFGHAHLIAVEDGLLAGGSDPRPRFGAAAGY
jgi:gamma-glutamyltranspeptidase / glutathione hydrolase